MNYRSLIAGLAALVCLTTTLAYASDIQIAALRCEYLTNPLGIDVTAPRLSWRLESFERNQCQSAYQLIVASVPTKLNPGSADMWDSGRVETDQSTHIVYTGVVLKSWSVCHWKVRVWDEQGGVSNWSEPAMWSMGPLRVADWTGATWIGADRGYLDNELPPLDNRTRLAARYLRREFSLNKPVRRATAYICGLGFFDLYLNGRRVGDHIMDPALSGYAKRAFYVTFDVTNQLQPNRNAVAVVLGNGRYYAPRETSIGNVGIAGYPKLFLKIRIEHQDGEIRNIVSDADWHLTAAGPIRTNNEFDGEQYDARMETPGWNQVGFNETAWKRVQLVDPPGGKLQAQMLEPMRIIETRKPVAITNPKPGMYIVDMGQVHYGMARLNVTGPAGTRVQMRSAYNVNPDGTLRTRDNRTALSTDVYYLNGTGTESWHPRFRGQGYRYVEITGFPGVPNKDNVEGLVVHTDFAQVGHFECSHWLINRIYSNIRWTQRAYIRSLSMEPDRDERQGWLGTQAKDFESNAYNFDVAALITKWLGDIRLDQLPDGHIPDVSPTYWSLYSDGIVWPSNIVILPELQHDLYGDRRILAANYPSMKKWMGFAAHHLKDDFTTDHNRYGDWCDAYSMDKGKETGGTPGPLISTAYFYHNCCIMARVAGLLNKPDDVAHFSSLANKIKTGFNQRFFNPTTKTYANGTQTSYVLPLAFGMVPADARSSVVDNLVHDVMVTRRGHLSVGMVGIFWLMQVLSQNGHPEVAFTIATQETRPSWGYMIAHGSTSVWERWDTDTRDPAMNSEALLILAGNLEAWFFQALAGINHDPNHPGFKQIILKPLPVGDLTFVKATHRSMYGLIASHWEIKENTFHWTITVPPNTSATVFVPTRDVDSVHESGKPAAEQVQFLRSDSQTAVFRVGSGTYKFTSAWNGGTRLTPSRRRRHSTR